MKRKSIIVIVIIALLLIMLGIILYNNNRIKDNQGAVDAANNIITVDNLKNEIGATGESDIYEVLEEYDGRKILTVKKEIEYQVALAGVLTSKKPDLETLNSIIETAPNKNGIYINESSRVVFINMINELTDGEYFVDNNGYLSVKSEGTNFYDKGITQLINGDKEFFIDVKGSNYIVDPMSGKIAENLFEEIEPEQTYEYYQNKDFNKVVLIFTTNKKNILSNQEIVNSFLDLFM